MQYKHVSKIYELYEFKFSLYEVMLTSKEMNPWTKVSSDIHHKLYIHHFIFIYTYPTPLHKQDVTQGQFLCRVQQV